MLFVRVGLAVEQLTARFAVPERQPPAAVDVAREPDRTELAHVDAELVLLDDHAVALDLRVEQIDALHADRHRQPRSAEHGARDVERARRPLHHHRRRIARIAPQQRHADQPLVVEALLEDQRMVAHQIAVVGGEHHHRVIGEAEPLQRGHDAPDRIVDHGDRAVVERDRLPQTGLGHGLRAEPSRREARLRRERP